MSIIRALAEFGNRWPFVVLGTVAVAYWSVVIPWEVARYRRRKRKTEGTE